MTEKKRLLFCMNVPWSWIKQRPHFIAEGLVDKYDVTVLSPAAFHKYRVNKTNLPIIKLFRLPFERLWIVAKLNTIIHKIQFRRSIKPFDVIWISLASQYNFIKKHAGNKTVVYDCMDDMLEFNEFKEKRRGGYFLEAEKAVYLNADIVFASSEHLKDVLMHRYGERDVYVVNNALRDGFAESSKPLTDVLHSRFSAGKTHISYIGTIDSWMDFDLLLKILTDFKDAIIHLWGPCGYVTIPNHERLVYEGAVEHDYVLSIMKASDILMMPFKVNKLIESVNPVKLYEYIYSGKPCLAPLYGESKQFGEYSYLYQSQQDCLDLIKELSKKDFKPKQDIKSCEAFANANTWSHRVSRMEECLADKIG